MQTVELDVTYCFEHMIYVTSKGLQHNESSNPV